MNELTQFLDGPRVLELDMRDGGRMTVDRCTGGYLVEVHACGRLIDCKVRPRLIRAYTYGTARWQVFLDRQRWN